MTPEEEIALLLRVVTKLAAKRLDMGGFIPFGAILGSKRDVQLLLPESIKKEVTRDELSSYWNRELLQAARKGQCRTACWCADVRIPKESGELIPALFVHLERAEICSEDILYPFRGEKGAGVEFGEPTTVDTEFQIFTSPLRPS